MRALYTVFAWLLAPVLLAVILWRGLRDRGYWHRLGERFGFGEACGEGSIWVHAVSVGEVQAAASLVRALAGRAGSPRLVLTTATPTGADCARALLGERVHVRYSPFDLPGSVRRFCARVQPRIGIILETELWPNLYRECGRRRVPLVLASARLSPRSHGRYRLLARLFRGILTRGVVIAAQSPGDAERFRSIGAPAECIHVTGNIKFDLTLPPDLETRARELRVRYGGDRPVWIAGSTHGGEEEIVLEAHAAVRRTLPEALLVLVPRHPPRFAEVAALLARRELRFVTRASGRELPPEAEVLLVDTLGELVSFYGAADVAFVGGSLVPIGGHNLLEPAALGLPVLTGPHVFNGEEIARLLLAGGAARTVRSAAELAAAVIDLLKDPGERRRMGALGREAVGRNRGALERVLALIDPLLSAACEARPAPAARLGLRR